jgi:hypothetical protein
MRLSQPRYKTVWGMRKLGGEGQVYYYEDWVSARIVQYSADELPCRAVTNGLRF